MSTTAESPASIPMRGAKKKVAKKKVAKKKAAANPSGPKEFGVDRDHDVPWNDKKVAVFKALKGAKAIGKDNAKGAADVIAKDNTKTITAKDVRHYCYHAKAAGLVDLVENVEGVRGYAFYLTAKGSALDPARALKEQEAAKAKK